MRFATGCRYRMRSGPPLRDAAPLREVPGATALELSFPRVELTEGYRRSPRADCPWCELEFER